MDGVLDKLLESTAKARLLKLFLMNPEREFGMPEIVKQTQLKKHAVQKELAKLLKLGLVKTRIAKAAKSSKVMNKAKTAKGTKAVKAARTAKSAKAAKIAKTKKKKQKSKKRK